MFLTKNISIKTRLLFVVLFFSFFQIYAQGGNQTNFWPIGDSIMLDFNYSPPTILKKNYSKYNTNTSISDYEGNLLFSTDNSIIRDKFGFKIDSINTYSNIIIPTPYNDSLYYIFNNIYKKDSSILVMNIINIKKNNGLGGVVKKDSIVIKPTLYSSFNCATAGDSNKNIWIIGLTNTDSIISISLSENGIDSIHTSYLGFNINNHKYMNPISFSIFGNYITTQTCVWKKITPGNDIPDSLRTIVFKFNKKNGEVFNPIFLPDSVYEINSFISPNEKYLFTNNFYNHYLYPNKIYSYDLTNYNTSNILNSKKLLYDYTTILGGHYNNWQKSNNDQPGQYTKNGDFVIVDAMRTYFQNDSYLLQSYKISKLSMNNNKIDLDTNFLNFNKTIKDPGFFPPYFLSSYFDSTHFQPCEGFESKNTCVEENTEFFGPECDMVGSRYEWHFGDAFSRDSLNISTERNPLHFYSQEGTYIVSLTVRTLLYTRYFKDTITVTKRFYDKPEIGSDTQICEGEEVDFTMQNIKDRQVLWSDSTTDISATYSTDGVVWGKIYNSCNDQFDSLYLKVFPKTTAILPIDTVICMQPTAKIGVPSHKHTTFEWNTGESTDSIVVSESGTYTVSLKNECFDNKYSINVFFEADNHGFTDVNIFSPNQDQINDLFTIYDSFSEQYSLKIFNRWGSLVFETQNSKQHWNGSDAPDGVYYYSIEYKNCLGEPEYRKGTVSVVR